ncbi:MAG: rhodanese-like domain-containing protein [Hyphomicrobiales bacterium]|nr:rhodanese-like domain-containing protein [Hyphomicrobiales bacterium]MBV8441114.1 rhodanese-like domain-containing protein [Hyphomicrobiales bacterium]
MFSKLFSRSRSELDPSVIDFEDFEEAVKADACVVVDVREPHEFAGGHIPMALNLPMSSFDASQLPSGKPVVLICQAGGRSRNALNKAQASGRDDVAHYAGGMNGWRMHGGDVAR